MDPGDRVLISDEYGRRFPNYAHQVGRLATVTADPALWPGTIHHWVEAHVDGDEHPGLFLRDELEEVSRRR